MKEEECPCEVTTYLELDKMLSVLKSKKCCAEHVVKALMSAACCIGMDHYPFDACYRDYLHTIMINTCDEIEKAVIDEA